MPDFRVDSIYNLTAIEEEQAKFLAFLAQSKSAILDLNNQRVVVKSSDVSTFTQASENLNKSVASSNVALKNITSTSVEYNKQLALSAKATKDAAQAKLIEAKAILEQEKADAIRTKSLIAQEKELERLIALEEKKNAAVSAPVIDGGSRNSSQAIQATEAQIQAAERLRDAEAQAAMSATEYGNSVNKSTGGIRVATAADLELEKARKAVAKANSTQNVELQGLNAQRSLANKAAKEEALTALGLLGPYKLLEKEYAAAAMNAKDLAVQYGVNSVQAKAAAAKALALNTQLQTIDKTVGQSQKNVGNYASAFTKGLSSIWGGLRKIAYIIPGLGIGGLILLLIDPLKAAGTALIDLFSKINRTRIAMETLGDVNIKAIDIYNKQTSAVQQSVSIINDSNISLKDRQSVLDKLIAQSPDYLRGLTLQNSTTAEGKKIIDDYIVSLENKAQIEAAGSVNADANKALAELKVQRDGLVELQKSSKVDISPIFKDIDKKIQEAQAKVDISLNIYKQKFKDNLTSGKESVKGIIEDLQEKISNLQKIQPTLLTPEAITKNVAEIKKYQDEIDRLLGKTKAGGKSSSANALQELKERLNTEFDIYKIAQEAKIRLFQNDIKSESTYYLDKLTAFDNYLKAQKELLDREEQHEIDLANNAAAREKQHLEEQKKGKSGAEQARIDQNILINQQNLEQQILLIKAKYADEGNKLIEGAAETRNKIVEDHLKIEKELYEQYSKDLQDNINKDNERIKKGFEERAKQEEDYAKEKIRLLKELHDEEAQLAEQSGNFLFSLATSGYENQLNLLTKQGEDIQKRKDQELAANDVLVQSTQDKAANVILINSRAQAEQDVLDRKAAAIKTKEAQFQRAQQIFEIGINTIKTIAAIKLAIAEETIKAIANPLLTPLIGLIAAQIPVALASSALSIGAVLATPLPRYKHGRGEKGEEFAIVGDGGVNEYIMRGTGQIEKTPAVNTLTHLMPKDKVYPNKESLMRELMFNNMHLSNYSVGQDGGINRNDIRKMTNEIVGAVSDIRIQTQLVTKSGWRNHNERLAKYDAWVDRVIKN